MARVRSVDFLPEIFQTSTNRQFLSATLDQLVQEPKFKPIQGYVGRRIGPGVNANDRYVTETDKARADYQLEPGVIVKNNADSRKIDDAITYPGILDAIALQGGITDKQDRLFTSDYYTWDPFVDFDKLINYGQYYWLPGGPDAVNVFSNGVPTTYDWTVTRENGVYTFSTVEGTNPQLTLVRGGNYRFNVAQNAKETVNFRVSNRATSAWVIDQDANPTLTLVRGNTYTFTLATNIPVRFYIKSQQTLGINNLYNNGVTNNGALTGTITFTVPQDAPDVLYYNNNTQPNMQGQINIINATPGTGPGFWIQAEPGVSGRISATPNISSREVLGVINNGEDLGTVTFEVPLANAQDFYYDLTPISFNNGKVDLICDLKFNQLENVFVDQFLADYPSGIDGITDLNGRTLIFTTKDTNPVTGGWQIISQFDPLARTVDNRVSLSVSYDVTGTPPGYPSQPYDIEPYETITDIISGPIDPNDGRPGSFDSLPYAQEILIDRVATQRSVWRIDYIDSPGGGQFMQLTSVYEVANLNKFQIQFGDQWSSTTWYKSAIGEFERQPLLTATAEYLYYQDGTDPEIVGRFKMINQDQIFLLDVNEILGAKNYTSPNGVVFTNGLKVTFVGDVFPQSYANNSYYVEGVGTAIKLLPTTDFITPELYTKSASVPYDSTPYDVGNFDASLNQPLIPDYLTINRAGADLNAWTRSNRWFHIDVILASAQYNNVEASLNNLFRARRPILEYRANTRLYDFGTQAKTPVDVIDFATTDAFSEVNGKTGYVIDGYALITGSRVIFANDVDPLVRNKIYQVEFITPDSVAPLISQPIINLTPTEDATPLIDQTTVVLNGITQQGKSYWYDGVDWILAQQKTSVNQAPLFNVYDLDGVSFDDPIKYPSNNFTGNKLFSYAQGPGNNDPVLGFPVKYLSLANIGDIVFDNNLYKDTFDYTINNVTTTTPVSNGYVRQYSDRTSFIKEIGWQPAVVQSRQRQQFRFVYDGQPLKLDVAVLPNGQIPSVQIFVASKFVEPSSYTVDIGTDTTAITLQNTYEPGDIVEVAVLSDQVSQVAFYEIPINLENNPLNINSSEFTLGTARNQYETICENLLNISGPINGANNTRDLGNIIPYGTNLLQQSAPLTMAGYFMRSQQYNIFAALEYNSREYEQYKAQLLEAVIRTDYTNYTVPEILTAVVTELVGGRTNLNPFYWTDMLPANEIYTESTTVYSVTSTPIFQLSTTYDFTSSNFASVLVYVNDILLTVGYDYEVSSDSPRLTILTPLEVGDVIVIQEYSHTYGTFVPNTPTKMGLYPAFKPRIYLDTSYIIPTRVIQGHDGSKTVAFGDFRDQLLLEFETRIYNNLKIKSRIPLTEAHIIPGQFRQTDYSLAEVNEILAPSFLSWVGWNKLAYQDQDYISNNQFTWNYSAASNKISGTSILDQTPLPAGAWRGINLYFYDTVDPANTPWEMLGFSQEPTWWQDRYGPAPYTSGNLVLWDDLAQGYVADPVAPYILPEFRRPGLEQILPVDSEGNLASPMQSVVGQYDSSQFQKSWVFGDVGPVEYTWRSSSAYPFAIMRLMALTKPAVFFSLFADRDLYKFDTEFDQYLYDNRYRLDANGVQVYGNDVSKASFINWIVDFNQLLGRDSTTSLTQDLGNLDVRLCYRVGAFTDKQYTQIYTERSSPNSLNTSLLLPDESYNLLLYKNQPFANITYSSVIVQVVEDGYAVFGYSITEPYFNILASRAGGTRTTITAGGTSVSVPNTYSQDVVQVPYGYVFTNQTMVCDFLLSYGALLQSQGLIFDELENGKILNWNQMAQEFLYFANQGWAIGAVINLNPANTKLTATRAQAVVDSVIVQTPENQILDQNRTTLPVRDLVVDRFENTFEIQSLSNQTISYLNLNFTSYETMIVLDNVSIFADLLYNPATGSRQSRVSISATVSADWNGQLDAQGFILNDTNFVQEWESNKKYAKGEIVVYKNNYWSAQTIVQPSLEFNYGDWVKSDYTKIQRGLLQNIPNKADQLAQSYDTNQANLDQDVDLLSYGLIGFRPRQYMTSLNLNDISQVNLYKQFIRDKGTLQSVQLLTNANLGKEKADYSIFENYAIQRAVYGANANQSFVELRLNRALLNSDPCVVQVVEPQQTSTADQTILLMDLWRQSYKLPDTNILPTYYPAITDTALPSAGYVNLDDVDITVFNLEAELGLAEGVLNTIGIGTTIWAAKINSYDWNVYRSTAVPGRVISVVANLNGTSVLNFSALHDLSVGNVIVVRYFDPSVDGVYRVLAVPSATSVVVDLADPTATTGQGLAFFLQTQRVAQASDAVNLPYATELVPGARIWIDNSGQGHWAVIEKQQPFDLIENLDLYDPIPNSGFGTSIAQARENRWALVGATTAFGTGALYPYTFDQGAYQPAPAVRLDSTDVQGYGGSLAIGNQLWAIAGASASNNNQGYAVMLYHPPVSLSFDQTQLLVAPDLDFAATEFGFAVTISDDERWAYIGAPGGNKVYAYALIEIESQVVEFITSEGITIYNLNGQIVYDTDEQLVVILNNEILIYGVDYNVGGDQIILTTAPAPDLHLVVSRRDQATFFGDGSTEIFPLDPYLYTATNIYSFTVKVNGVIQRPEIDYDFNSDSAALGLDLVFAVAPAEGDLITVDAVDYWQYVSTITVPGLDANARFGASLATSTDGRQVIIGAPNDSADIDHPRSGCAYVFDRNVTRYLVNDVTQLTYALPAGFQEPVAVLLNNQFLQNTDQFLQGQFSVVGSNVVLNSSVTLHVGDVIEIESNIFTQTQKIVADSLFDEADFGAAVDLCPTNCSIYIGAPSDGTLLPGAGSVQRNVNQNRVYGTVSATIANPVLTAGDSININNFPVLVPAAPNNTVLGLAAAINNYNSNGVVNGIPNVRATVSNGILTLTVANFAAAQQFSKLLVTPGIIGSAFSDLGFEPYGFTQTITSPNPVPSAQFGYSVFIDSQATTLVVGAPQGNLFKPTTFDQGTTYFDDRSTTFSTTLVQSGAVYTFDYLESANSTISNPGKFVFGQQIYTQQVQPLDRWGTAVNYVSGELLVGNPGNDLGDSTGDYGQVAAFLNSDRRPAWTVIRAQQPVVNVYQLNNVFMYDKMQSSRTYFFDFFDPLQGKILGAARQNIDYIGAVDPAKYNQGPFNNNGNFWAREHVGEIWWDTASVRFIDPNQDDLTYASRRWGQVFPGSQVEIYQWTQNTVPPTNYSGAGRVKNDTSWTVKTELNAQGTFTTYYYYWVTGIDTIATGNGKTLSTTGIARYIEFPQSSGIPYIAGINSSTVAIYNGLQYISAADTILHIGFDREITDANTHVEYELIADGESSSFLSTNLYRKLQDSLCGHDLGGAHVPDVMLSPPERYGVQFRPRQSMFLDRYEALQNYLTRANRILKNYPIVETRQLTLLNSSEPEPSAVSGAWNKRLLNIEELGYQDIYAVPLGYNYLIASDSTNAGLWTIYTVVSGVVFGERETRLTRVQTYDTRKYWQHLDWYLPGYNPATVEVAEVPVYASLASIENSTAVGASVRVDANAQGKWEIYQRTATGWVRVGLQDGTIEFKAELWNYALGGFGFDVTVFDAGYFDQEPVQETRKIIQAINQELFINELAIERNKLLILIFEIILSQFESPEWLTKTSLIDVRHNIRELVPFQVYRRDNQEFVLDYLQEVKPYHVQVKEFFLSYDGIDSYDGTITDFDSPSYFNNDLEIPQYVNPVLLPYTVSTATGTGTPNNIADTPADAEIWALSPWDQWYGIYKFSVDSVTVTNGGIGYTEAPIVDVAGESVTPAVFAAVVDGGQVTEITVVNPGAGYSAPPVLTLIGGGGTGATAEAVMTGTYLTGTGQNYNTVPLVNQNIDYSLVRSFTTTIKYDRYQYQSDITEWQANVNYDNGTQVRYDDRVWAANSNDSSAVNTPTFDPDDWTLVAANLLSGIDRTQGFYVATPNQPGLSLPLLIDGLDYPGVQVTAPTFSQNTGFDVGNYDINPFDNISYGPEGRPTYDPGILDAIYESEYLDPYLGVLPAPAYDGDPPNTGPNPIVVAGGGYVDTYSSHAPEELIPGSEFDTLDFRVFTNDGDSAVTGPNFRIFQDMRGIQATYRITPQTTTQLAQPLAPTDTVIYVDDASAMPEPNLAENIWGVITIKGERIMYRYRDVDANTLSGLRRGTGGTGTGNSMTAGALTGTPVVYDAGTTVYDMARDNLLPEPYQNYIVSNQEIDPVTNRPVNIGDGSTVLFTAPTVDLGSLDSTSLIEAVEVYIGGIRTQAGYTILTDNPVEVLFDTPPPAGYEVLILARRANSWYNPLTPDLTLGQTNTVPARFLRGE